MAKLPNADRAFVDLHKLTSYALDPTHRTGRYKARVFEAALGLTAAHAETLAPAPRMAAVNEDADLERLDQYGAHYSMEFMLEFDDRSALIRSLWTVRLDEDLPPLVSTFVA